MAYIKKIWKDYPDTTTQIKAEDLNKMDKGIYDLTTGWISADETWTYSSVDNPTGVITISGDKTGKYSLGMRIKFTNGGNVIYGIITKISYSSPNTTLTFLHEINPSNSLAVHLMANSAITNNYYSNMKVPFGFPSSSDKWTIRKVSTAYGEQANPTANTWYNLGGSFTIPIGKWNVRYKCEYYTTKGTAGFAGSNITLSIANNSSSNSDFDITNISNSEDIIGSVISDNIPIDLSSK